MIKIENVDVTGWEASIRGMRNPLNSWAKSDSYICKNSDCLSCSNLYDLDECVKRNGVGDNDLTLMRKLAAAGTDHAKYRRMITVTADVVAPLYWWKEYDTYKVGTVANSCSTMHKIQAKEFTPEDFSTEHLLPFPEFDVLLNTIKHLNNNRALFLETKDKSYWWQMIQLLPSSYNQRRTVQLNYEVLANIYHSRKTHKLDEWRTFCTFIEQLPHSEIITG